jgi:hypothetical protein
LNLQLPLLGQLRNNLRKRCRKAVHLRERLLLNDLNLLLSLVQYVEVNQVVHESITKRNILILH